LELALETAGDVLGSDRGISMGRFAEAAEYFDRAYQIAVKSARQDAHDSDSRRRVASAGLRLAAVVRQSEPRRALEIYDEIVARVAEVKNNTQARRNEARALAASTYPLRKLGRSAEARKRLDSVFPVMREMKLYPAETIEPGSVAGEALCALADMQADAGKRPRGIEIYRELTTKLMPTIKPEARLEDAAALSDLYRAHALMLRRAGQVEAAEAIDARRLELWRQWERKLPNNPFVLRQISGR
jgi:hypothetical protein